MPGGISMLFEYETPKMIQIGNLKVGVTQRVIQLCILVYVVCWVLLYEKGYQDSDVAITSVTTKLKGISFTDYQHIPMMMKRTWDIPDLVVPPLEDDAFFITTNMIVTEKQKPGKCAEDPTVYGSSCKSDEDCPLQPIGMLGNGANTGKCIVPSGKDVGSCEIYSWCPVENDTLPLGENEYMFPMIENYTLLIKNDITFAKFKIKRRNMQEWVTKRFLRTCRYQSNHPEYKYCPIFKLSTIFEEAKVDKSIFIKGGVIGIDIDWNCDLDWNVRYCNPKYTFSRLDDENAPIGRGFNFRYANYYYVDGELHRDLIKAIGIRFLVNAHGSAGKFHILPITMNLGSGLALLGLAPTICDILALHFLRSKSIYQQAKFETIEAEVQRKEARREERRKSIATINSTLQPINRRNRISTRSEAPRIIVLEPDEHE